MKYGTEAPTYQQYQQEAPQRDMLHVKGILFYYALRYTIHTTLAVNEHKFPHSLKIDINLYMGFVAFNTLSFSCAAEREHVDAFYLPSAEMYHERK